MTTLSLLRNSLPIVISLTLPLTLPAQDNAKPSEDTPVAVCSCCTVKSTDDAQSYALRGVIENVLTEQQALLVKHEEIPGFMRAMTMMFQVDDALLPQVNAGDKITAQMKRSENGRWLLEDVKVIDS